MKHFTLSAIILFLVSSCAVSQNKIIYPQKDNKGWYITIDNKKHYAIKQTSPLVLSKIKIEKGKKGLMLNTGNDINGMLTYGFIDMKNQFPYPVFFKHTTPIKNGKVIIPISNLSGKYDMINWQKRGYGIMGIRIANEKGELLHDMRIGFIYKNKMFYPATYLTEIPSVNNVTDHSATIRFVSNKNTQATLKINNKIYKSNGIIHEIKINNLQANTKYNYTVICGIDTLNYYFTTFASKDNPRTFKFAYASDSRAGQGGGERNLYGTNAYIMKKLMAVAAQNKVNFIQFSGDLINGYSGSYDELKLEYSNWKSAIAPFRAYIPVFTTMGNHEVYNAIFPINDTTKLFINYMDTQGRTGETIFQEEFVNPQNGPDRENGFYPGTSKPLPSYKETAYYYIYGNTAIIVLNSNYLYNPELPQNKNFAGNVHAYIMDKQLAWLQKTIQNFEQDNSIKNIFISLHTPFFPNGGHSTNDMWYKGSNDPRPIFPNKKYNKGIIERRDQLLDILVNQSTKVKAILTGDEHNYCRLKITPNTPIYPKNWNKPKLKLIRTIWQINNGAAGAPYYAKEHLPWTKNVLKFSTENAVIIFEINPNKNKIHIVVINPDTLNKIDEFDI